MVEQEGRTFSLPRQQFHSTTCLIYFVTLESIEGLQHPGEELDGKLWLILVNFNSQSISALSRVATPYPWPHGRQLYTCSWSSLHATCKT